MRTESHLIQSFTTRKPCGHTASPVAGQLRLTAIRIEEPQKKFAVRPALQKLNTIRPNAGVPRAELTCQFSMTPPRQMFFNNQEVVAAGVRLHKRNHDVLILPQHHEMRGLDQPHRWPAAPREDEHASLHFPSQQRSASPAPPRYPAQGCSTALPPDP